MKPSMQEHWIRVATSQGMFSAERAVSLTLIDGKEVSFFVDVSQIRHERDGSGELRVTLVESDDERQRQLVLLPTETFETSSRWVEVAA
ncbi:MAG: hypothetical protein QM795_17535 [Pseudoxanthomonas sp.]